MDDIKLHLTNRDVLFEIIKKLDYFESRLDAMEEDINLIKKKILELPERKSGWLGGYWEIKIED
jgi:hypothetical protein